MPMKRPREIEAFVPVTTPGAAHGTAREYRALGEAELHGHGFLDHGEMPADADVIARHVFNTKAERVPGIDYSIEYNLSEGYAGGDVVDVYEFDNGSVAFTGADVDGRGVKASILATLIKFSLRGYSSAGMTPEACMMSLNRLYLEHCAFEQIDSFASAFFAHVDKDRRTVGYCSAGHDVAFLLPPDESPVLLPVTAPVVGVFSSQHRLFAQRYMELKSGSILIIGTHGITESRNAEGEFFGIERLLKIADLQRDKSMAQITTTILAEALGFAHGPTRDDIALLAARFH